MEALQCELCGGKLTIKSGGIAVCEYCGMEYTAERIKERILEIKGTVRIDNAHLAKNYIEMATTALDAKNYKEAITYLNKIIEIEPNNYWAWYQKGIAATKFRDRLEEAVTCLKKALDLVPQDNLPQLKSKAIAEYETSFQSELYDKCNSFIDVAQKDFADYVLNTIRTIKKSTEVLTNEYGLDISSWSDWIVRALYNTVCSVWEKICSENREVDPPNEYFWRKLVDVGSRCVSILDEAISFSGSDNNLNIRIYRKAIEIIKKMLDSRSYNCVRGNYYVDGQLSDETKSFYTKKMEKYNVAIQRIVISQKGYAYLGKVRITSEQFSKIATLVIEDKESSAVRLVQKLSKYDEDTAEFIVSQLDRFDFTNPQSEVQTSSGGCYIATAVYGSYDCPQVWTLRRYRDNILAKTWYGRAFIHIYYALSPSIVKHFGKANGIKKIWKSMLDPIVERLNADGVGNTPNEDQKW